MDLNLLEVVVFTLVVLLGVGYNYYWYSLLAIFYFKHKRIQHSYIFRVLLFFVGGVVLLPVLIKKIVAKVRRRA